MVIRLSKNVRISKWYQHLVVVWWFCVWWRRDITPFMPVQAVLAIAVVSFWYHRPTERLGIKNCIFYMNNMNICSIQEFRMGNVGDVFSVIPTGEYVESTIFISILSMSHKIMCVAHPDLYCTEENFYTKDMIVTLISCFVYRLKYL